jgi:hypothetical protein
LTFEFVLTPAQDARVLDFGAKFQIVAIQILRETEEYHGSGDRNMQVRFCLKVILALEPVFRICLLYSATSMGPDVSSFFGSHRILKS